MKPRKRMAAGSSSSNCDRFSKRRIIFLLCVAGLAFYTPWFYWCAKSQENIRDTETNRWSGGDLRDLEMRWNNLQFGNLERDEKTLLPHLKIALFVKKWPSKSTAGGLERHARTLHVELGRRGHEIHVFTSFPTDGTTPAEESANFRFYFSNPTPRGNLNPNESWKQFLQVNETLAEGFDILHSESVALPHNRAQESAAVFASWHGIAYETIHSDIVQDLARPPGEVRSREMQTAITERVQRVIDEIKFFRHYSHHVATSDAVGEVLRTIYMLPKRSVHVIVNGVDETIFSPDKSGGRGFRRKYGIPDSAKLVVGIAGRLVRDKGHPLVFEALKTLLPTEKFRGVYVAIAGDGPWGDRYRELAPAVKVLGSLSGPQIGEFFNSLDVFLNPTMRAQGLDHTLIEAMLCGTPLLASRFSSILQSVVVGPEYGYTFSPTLESLVDALRRVVEDGKEKLARKGLACRERASVLFTAKKMADAYERLFVCVAKGNRTGVDFCEYPLSFDSCRERISF
eukprot:TRINITY_DN14436_c0_g1_i1.p1 TRINITY_DN14436_c0_g1~~TRINITY_DN14436_c0_g1_i1.p1  ORF type:complete len:512 (+),score=-25.59 TRINITY_DN14436_c0_g1_i1:514-2049(+)